jgi:hypothetical protein
MRDVLCLIENDSHILAMLSAMAYEKVIDLPIDHNNFIKGLRREVIVPIPSKYLGGSASGKEDAENTRDAKDAENTEDAKNASEKEDAGDANASDCADSEFYDSDWDVEDGDDDLFLDNVDKDVNDHNEHTDIVEHEDDAGLEHEDLNMSREEYMKLAYKFKEFNAHVDMEAPIFKVVMLFSSMQEFKVG